MESLSPYLQLLQSDYWVPSKGQQLAIEYQYLILSLTAAYIPAIFLGQYLMRKREPFPLRVAAFVWNVVISAFSGIGMILILVTDWQILLKTFYPENSYHPTIRAVIAIFTLTKVIEFGDTAFLVLRKKPVRFLHAYHHVSVTLYVWHAQSVSVGFAHHFVFVNLAIHTAMYMYYALACVCPRHPLLRAVRPYITISQVLQMFMGTWLSYQAIAGGTLNEAHLTNAWLALAMYGSYVYLFGKFYLDNYGIKLLPFMTVVCCVCFLWYQNAWSIESIAESIGGYVFAYLFLFLHVYSS